MVSGFGFGVVLLLVGLVGADGCLQRCEERIEAAVTHLPKLAVLLEPVDGLLHRGSLDLDGPAGAGGGARHETGALEDLQVLADRRLADLEGCGELVHRSFPLHQPREDGATGGGGEGDEGGIELFGRVHLRRLSITEVL